MKPSEFIDADLDSLEPATDKFNPSLPGKSHTSQPSAGRVELDARVEQARQQMLDLRRQQEELERERQDLEELRRREEEFEHGKAEILEELTRTVSLIEQEEFDLNKRNTLLVAFREEYQNYIRQLNDIRESEWTSTDLKLQLNKAFVVVEAARAELNKGRAQLQSLGDGPLRLPTDGDSVASGHTPATGSGDHPESFDFLLEFKRGFARHLPLILFAALALLIYLSRKS